MKITPFLLLFCLFTAPLAQAQDASWFYLRAKDSLVEIPFNSTSEILKYQGSDVTLQRILNRYSIFDFKKTQRNTNNATRNTTFFVRASSFKLLDELLTLPQFVSGVEISEEDKKIYEPNDYGLTSTIGKNLGDPAFLDYLDFLGLPKAWYYTTGNRDVIIAISDATIDTTDIEFRGKSSVIRKTGLSKGHGISTAGNIAAQGDNAHGIPGLCYDCSVYATNYGDFFKLNMLNEVSKLKNVKAINCSWAGKNYKESAQQVIDSIYDRGVLVVASSGNDNWTENKGGKENYPASYDKVISVGTAMYRYEKPEENIKMSPNGKPYVENIRGYLSRTAGFEDHDITKKLKLYPISTASLNKYVDIVTPTVGLYSYGERVLNDTIWYSQFPTTSAASPQVSGTIGLMYSLQPQLPHTEVESILKITSTNIDHIEVNKPYAGNYGAGMLNTGKAVKLVFDLYNKKGTAYIDNQDFSRWHFKTTGYCDKIVMENQIFRDDASLDLVGRKQIVLKPNTHLKPNENSRGISIKIDNTLVTPPLRLRDESILEE